MLDPALVDAIGGLSATSLFVLAIWALYTRRIRTGSEAADIEKRHEQDEAELRKERDEWKAVAQDAQRNLAKLTATIEDKLDIKVPPAS